MSWLRDVFDSTGRFIARNAGRASRGLGIVATVLDPALYIISRMAGGDSDPILTAAIEKRNWRLIGIKVGSWIAAGAIEYGATWLAGLVAAAGTATLVGSVAGFVAGAGIFLGGTMLAAGVVEMGTMRMRQEFRERYPREYRQMIESGRLQRDGLLDGASLDQQRPTNVAGLDTRRYQSTTSEVTATGRPIRQVVARAPASRPDRGEVDLAAPEPEPITVGPHASLRTRAPTFTL